MQFLDMFLREELFDFVETTVHSLPTPPLSPASNGVVSETVPDSVVPPQGVPNTIYLAQTFIGKVAAFGPNAPYPDDLHARFRHAITNFPEAARLTVPQLKGFDNDYSALTRERAITFHLTQQNNALLELDDARSKLRDAEAEHDLHVNNHSTSCLAAAQQEFDAKRAKAMSLTTVVTRCLTEVQTVLTYGVYWGSEAEPPLLEVPELASL